MKRLIQYNTPILGGSCSIRIRLLGFIPNMRIGFVNSSHPNAILRFPPVRHSLDHYLGEDANTKFHCILANIIDPLWGYHNDRRCYVDGTRIGTSPAFRFPERVSGMIDQTTTFILRFELLNNTFTVYIDDDRRGSIDLRHYQNSFPQRLFPFVYLNNDVGFDEIDIAPLPIRLQ